MADATSRSGRRSARPRSASRRHAAEPHRRSTPSWRCSRSSICCRCSSWSPIRSATLPEITQNGLIALPHSFRLDAWPQAWAHYLRRRHLRGHPAQFLQLALDDDPGDDHLDAARRASTATSSRNGASRARRSLFICMLLGVFMPGQIALLPWAYHPRQARPRQLGLRPDPRPRASRACRFTTLFCRNYYVNIPDDLIKAARIDGAGFWRIFCKIILPLSPPILIVTVIWQFTGIWNEYPVRRRASLGGRSSRSPRRWSRCRPAAARVRTYDVDERRGDDRRAAAAADLFLRRQVFRPRPHPRRHQVRRPWRR